MLSNLNETTKEFISFRMSHDPLFRRLVDETVNETNDNKYNVGLALVDLVLEGKVEIVLDPLGGLLFERTQPN